ncbi:6-phosphogluconolactonase [Candidatus Curculioniphilus buchneri]|uniref:6-phosphogluconolactonase n=1 Tax=Candidatus Curculioniphilus buchneri TaxID=690594 RepID=UPI00376F08FD
MDHIVYVTSPESQQIHVWKMDRYGILTLLQVKNTPGQGQPIVIHPKKMRLYIGMRPLYSVLSYLINKQGLLSEENLSTQIGCPTYLTIDYQNETLYYVSYRRSYLSVSIIDKQGIISAPIQMLEGLQNCHSANIESRNRMLWVPCLNEDKIRLYHIDQAGYLTPSSPEAIKIKNGAGPRHMVFHPNGNYAYVLNELNGIINVISINIGNVPSIIQALDIIPINFSKIYRRRWASDIHITPDGRWLYACDRASSLLSHFNVLDDGSTLSLSSCQKTEIQPRSFAIDSQGTFLIVAGQNSHHIRVYHIESKTGKPISMNRYMVGKGPTWVTISVQNENYFSGSFPAK